VFLRQVNLFKLKGKLFNQTCLIY